MFYRSSYRNKKGFSLVELLVVIAIIGILAAVGITAYSGYTANAKAKAATSQNKDIVSLLNSAFAKCAGGDGEYPWTTVVPGEMGAMDMVTNDPCSAAPTQANIITYINDVLGLKNPYATDQVAAVAGTTPTTGQTALNCSADNCAIVTETAPDVETPITTVSVY